MLPLTGEQVGCIIYASVPLTVSLILTEISPSLKRPTSASPRGTPNSFAISAASPI